MEHMSYWFLSKLEKHLHHSVSCYMRYTLTCVLGSGWVEHNFKTLILESFQVKWHCDIQTRNDIVAKCEHRFYQQMAKTAEHLFV